MRHAARATDEQASGVQDTAQVLEAAVQGLRKTVNRVVRTSTDSVGRRNHDREPLNMPARLTLSGQPPVDVRLANLSLAGALLRGVAPIVPGTVGRLQFAELDLAVTIRRSPQPGDVGVQFSNAEPARGEIERLLAHRGGGSLAA